VKKVRRAVNNAPGKHVLNTSISDKTIINVTDLNEGIYTLTIKTAGYILNEKLVILR